MPVDPSRTSKSPRPPNLRVVNTRKAEIDTLNAAGAGALAAKIRAFWGSMGWAVRVDVVPQGRANGDAFCGIRSSAEWPASTAIITVKSEKTPGGRSVGRRESDPARASDVTGPQQIFTMPPLEADDL
jgi:hypothetical protein